MVIPVMDYSADVWGFKYSHKCNRVQTILLFGCRLHSRAPVVGIQGDVGWILPKYRRLLKMLQLWNHLLYLDGNRLTKHILIGNMQIILLMETVGLMKLNKFSSWLIKKMISII